MKKPVLVEHCDDRGNHVFWALLDMENGKTLWIEDEKAETTVIFNNMVFETDFCPRCGTKMTQTTGDWRNCPHCHVWGWRRPEYGGCISAGGR